MYFLNSYTCMCLQKYKINMHICYVKTDFYSGFLIANNRLTALIHLGWHEGEYVSAATK